MSYFVISLPVQHALLVLSFGFLWGLYHNLHLLSDGHLLFAWTPEGGPKQILTFSLVLLPCCYRADAQLLWGRWVMCNVSWAALPTLLRLCAIFACRCRYDKSQWSKEWCAEGWFQSVEKLLPLCALPPAGQCGGVLLSSLVPHFFGCSVLFVTHY